MRGLVRLLRPMHAGMHPAIECRGCFRARGRREGGGVLEARDLACWRGDRAIFAGLSFTLEAGGALLLLGANGAGKSSLLRLLAGLIPAAEGVSPMPPGCVTSAIRTR